MGDPSPSAPGSLCGLSTALPETVDLPARSAQGEVDAAEYLRPLNPRQREAVTHSGAPLLIIAGAGTGKTTTLASRTAHLVASGVSPDRILLLTFTRRAASEMLYRAARVVGGQAVARIWSGTFHATANRLLRTYAGHLGFERSFTVLDAADSADLINLIRAEKGHSERKSRRFPQKNSLLSIYSRVVNSGLSLEDSVLKYHPQYAEEIEQIGEILAEYVSRKRSRSMLDYDDLLIYWHALLKSEPILEQIAGRFEQILVDEYQDTNRLQASILQSMRRKHYPDGITVVGDDAQSIYSFRGATVKNILEFPSQFPGCRVITLEQNYRSIQTILDASNSIMDPVRERYTKRLFTDKVDDGEPPRLHLVLDDSHQSRVVCDRVMELREQGISLREQAVLFRAGWHSNELEIELQRRNIPFVKYGGLRFLESAHVKDLVSLLRMVVNPEDEMAWFRILQLLPGIGPGYAQRLFPQLSQSVRAAGSEAADPVNVPRQARDPLNSLLQALAQVQKPGGAAAPPALVVERMRQFYNPLLEQTYDNADMRGRDLDQLTLMAAKASDLESFVTDLTLDPPSSTSDLAGEPFIDDDYLVLSTVHSAKGLEWDAVYIIHACDGMFPSDMACRSEEEIEEERRLFYVAMTRARRYLHVFSPQRYYWRHFSASDAHGLTQISRFLSDEVKSRFQELSEVASGFAACVPDESIAVAVAELNDIQARFLAARSK